jgi:integrase/recombinase XerD
VTGGILVSIPAGYVRGPKYVVTWGKTPVLSREEMRQLLKSIDTGELIGLRDRALLALMGYSFARVNALVTLGVEDYFSRAGGPGSGCTKRRQAKPCHHSMDEYLDTWIAAAKIADDKKGPLFRSFKKGDKLTTNPMTRSDMLSMIKRRAKGPPSPTPPAAKLFPGDWDYGLSSERRDARAYAANPRAPVATYHQTV